MRVCVFTHGPYNKSFKAEIGNLEIMSHLVHRDTKVSHTHKERGLISFQSEHAPHSCCKTMKTGLECVRTKRLLAKLVH